jgi:hypothetical protein
MTRYTSMHTRRKRAIAASYVLVRGVHGEHSLAVAFHISYSSVDSIMSRACTCTHHIHVVTALLGCCYGLTTTITRRSDLCTPPPLSFVKPSAETIIYYFKSHVTVIGTISLTYRHKDKAINTTTT